MTMHTAEVQTGRPTGLKPHTLVASDRVEGTPVRRPNGQKIGSIQRLMIDKLTGNVAYAVLSFGGFLGMGKKHLPIPWARLGLAQVKLQQGEPDAARALPVETGCEHP